MDILHAAGAFGAAFLAGAINSVAGGGTLVSFPTLVWLGLNSVTANATSTVAIWPGTVGSAWGYRRELRDAEPRFRVLIVPSLIGGIAGAVLLLRTPPHTFMRVLPWLMLGATLLFAFGKRLTGNRVSSVGHDATVAAIVGASIFELGVAVYGGYFGGGIGIVNLAMLAAVGMTNIHAMNALKSVLGTTINGVAALVFILKGAIYWPQAVVMIVGALVGGYFGAHYAQKLPQPWIRGFVILVGTAMTGYFLVKAYW